MATSAPTGSAFGGLGFLPVYDNAAVPNGQGTSQTSVKANGHINLKRYTTKPTTGLTKGDLFLMFHGSRPMLCVCASTAGQQIRIIRLRTKTNGRLTA